MENAYKLLINGVTVPAEIYRESTTVKSWMDTYGNVYLTFDYNGKKYISECDSSFDGNRFNTGCTEVARKKDL
ncbi:MAG: hypothetical protein ACRC6X_08220 [Culicoidibacterales bacterium]